MNDPYVPTNTGYRRKIGPKSKYGMNAAPKNGADGTPYGTAPGSRLGMSGSRLGMASPRRESNFQTSLREARELSEANAAMEAKEKARTAQAKAAETERKQTRGTNRQAAPFAAAAGRRPSAASGISDMLKKAREAGKRPGRTPYRGGMK
jgi:hypothetical protein